jgi:hypothetical protein
LSQVFQLQVNLKCAGARQVRVTRLNGRGAGRKFRVTGKPEFRVTESSSSLLAGVTVKEAAAARTRVTAGGHGGTRHLLSPLQLDQVTDVSYDDHQYLF